MVIFIAVDATILWLYKFLYMTKFPYLINATHVSYEVQHVAAEFVCWHVKCTAVCRYEYLDVAWLNIFYDRPMDQESKFHLQVQLIKFL